MSAPNAATAATTWVAAYDICPDCDGEGCHLHIGAPGWYDPHQHAWYPSEEVSACPTCGGSGRIERHALEPAPGKSPNPSDSGSTKELPF